MPASVALSFGARNYWLGVSSNGRYLVDQAGAPILLVADCGSSAIAQLSKADVITYLNDRSNLGFNLIWMELIEHQFADHAPANFYNDSPFSGTAFQSSQVEAYFAHADYCVQQAGSRGITVLLFPLYLGSGGGSEGWAAEVTAASTAQMAAWGTYVGNRYKDFRNIIWCVGGDWDPTTVLTKVNAFANALVAADPNHLVTFHDSRGNQGYTHLAGATWLTLNSTYTDSDTHTQGAAAYARSPAQPFFLIESYFENEHSMTRQGLRAELYWTILSGGCGAMFGNCPIWGMGSTASSSFCSAGTWQSNLNSAAAQDAGRLKKLLASRAWHTLIPDTGHTLITAGYGSTTTTVTSGVNAAGTLAIAYLPVNATVTVDCTKMSGTFSAKWIDPTTGVVTAIGSHANTGTQNYTSTNNAAGDADQVLVLEIP